MAITFYWGSGSPYSWRAMLALHVKGLEYDSKLVQFSTREHKTDAFLALNPRGKVPTLVDGDHAVYESLAIIRYLDAKFPDPPLFGTTPEEVGVVSRWISEHESYVEHWGNKIIRPLYAGDVDGKAADIKDAAKKLHDEMARMERALANGPYLTGERLTAVDLCHFPSVQSLRRAASKPAAGPLDLEFLPLEGRYPGIVAWERRIESIPGYDATYPPHWRDAG